MKTLQKHSFIHMSKQKSTEFNGLFTIIMKSEVTSGEAVGGNQAYLVTGKVHIDVAGCGLFCVAMPTATNKGRLTTNRASEMYIYIIELS